MNECNEPIKYHIYNAAKLKYIFTIHFRATNKKQLIYISGKLISDSDYRSAKAAMLISFEIEKCTGFANSKPFSFITWN